MVAPDLRYRIGVDLLLACFAGVAYARAVSAARAQVRSWLAVAGEGRPLPSRQPVP